MKDANSTSELLANCRKAEEFFSDQEKDPLDAGSTVRKILKDEFGWEDEQFGTASKPFQIDLGARGVPVISPHPKVKKQQNIAAASTPIEQLLKPGSSIMFDREGIKVAKLGYFFSHGFKAFDQIAWRNFLGEGAKTAETLRSAQSARDANPVDWTDFLDRWWLISEVDQHTFGAQSHDLKIACRFPHLVLTQSEFVRLRRPNQEGEKHFKNYLEAMRVIDERGPEMIQDLMQSLMGRPSG